MPTIQDLLKEIEPEIDTTGTYTADEVEEKIYDEFPVKNLNLTKDRYTLREFEEIRLEIFLLLKDN